MRGTNVLFCGDVNVDIIMEGLTGPLEVDREVLSTGFEVILGSSAAIAASAHARLGGATVFAGLGGRDAYGDLMRNGLNEAGVDTRYLNLSPDHRTGVTVNAVQPAGRYQITYPGAIPRFVPDVAAIIADQSICHVHFAGIYLQVDLLPKLSAILAALRANGIATSVDPQWDASRVWSGLDTWVTQTSILFVNEEEACALAKTDELATAQKRLGAACPTVVIKRGAHGVVVKSPAGEWSQAGIKVALRDAIGAGDNLAAAFLYATITAKMPTPTALAYANAAAARSCMFAGGAGARSTNKDILTFMETHR